MIRIGSATVARSRDGKRVTPELRNKILFTVGLLLLYRIGSYLPVPGVPTAALLGQYSDGVEGMGAMVSMLNLFSGGALSRMSFFALGTMPYITSQIIVQMLGSVIPQIGAMGKDEAGRRKLNQWTRYLTVVLALVNAISYLFLLDAWNVNLAASSVPFAVSAIVFVVTMVIGALVVMWMGELITQRGVGNGMSLVIAVNILSGVPSALVSSWDGGAGWPVTLAVLACTVLIVPVIVLIERGQRRLPITYSKQVRGQSVIGGGSTYLPIKVNFCGVIPIIFASTVLAIPSQLAVFAPGVAWVQELAILLSTGWVNWVANVALIIFFAYFYSSVVFDPDESAEDIQRAGGFIPGFRPGKPTADYIRSVVSHVTLPGACVMAALAVVPSIVYALTGASVAMTFGGTSMLILVGVVIDTAAAISAQSRDYDGLFA